MIDPVTAAMADLADVDLTIKKLQSQLNTVYRLLDESRGAPPIDPHSAKSDSVRQAKRILAATDGNEIWELTEGATLPDAVRFKPLVWREVNATHYAMTPFVVYRIILSVGCYYVSTRDGMKLCDSIEHGKQLAEQDWQRRLREVLA